VNGPAEHPTLINVSRWIKPGEIDLQLGDRLLRVGGTDLGGVGRVRPRNLRRGDFPRV
jgi:hypothetical protein